MLLNTVAFAVDNDEQTYILELTEDFNTLLFKK